MDCTDSIHWIGCEKVGCGRLYHKVCLPQGLDVKEDGDFVCTNLDFECRE